MCRRDYIRKQTLANAERYITPELKEYEEKVLGAEEKILDLEYRLFQEVREKVACPDRAYPGHGQKARRAGLHRLACRGSGEEQLYPSRHRRRRCTAHRRGKTPVIEQLTEERFVPNDTLLDTNENQLIIITGPNMAGKSHLHAAGGAHRRYGADGQLRAGEGNVCRHR